MRRVLAFAIVCGVAVGGAALAAQRGGGADQGPPQVTVQQVRENLYMLQGGGGNTGVFVTSTGVVVVDAKNPGWGQAILDAIREITPQPVTTLINTHTHGDHVSGNAAFPAAVDIVVQENTATYMADMPVLQENGGAGLPDRTFADRLIIGSGPDAVELYYFGPGHTGGDAVVVFPALAAAHAGDLFAGRSLPIIDGDHGGSVLRYADTLRRMHDGISGVDTIINGHNPSTTTWDDLGQFASLNEAFLTWAQGELRSGRTAEQAAANWQMPDGFDGFSANVPTLFGGLVGRLDLLAREMREAGILQ